MFGIYRIQKIFFLNSSLADFANGKRTWFQLTLSSC